jgi:galactonate dehydratase
MKITDIKVFTIHPGVGKNLMFVKIETDEGITGWGEAYTQSDRDASIEAHITELSRYLVDRDPFHIRHFTHIAYEDFATKRGAMDFHCAVSGLEIAMWDIVGKALGQPVYNLLGGPVRPRIKLYANGWSGAAESPDDYAGAAQAAVDDLGFTALKFDPFPGPWRLYPDHEELEKAAAIVGAVREAVGPRVELLIEVHRRLAPMNAIRVAKMIEPYRPYWFEEPCPAENLLAIKEVRDSTPIPVVTGEALYTRTEFREVLERRAVDIINPDICNTGGILELTHIAAMAEPYYVAVSPHGWNSTSVAAAAAVHASAVMPNFLIYEYALSVEPVSRDISSRYLKAEGGYIELPTEPGLGVELDEARLAKYPYKKFAPRPIRTVEDERRYD